MHPLRRTLAEGGATLGYLVTMPSVQLVQALARTGVDWLMIGTEHAPILAHGTVSLGGIAFSADDARAMIARGYRFVVLGSDAGLVAGAAQRMVQAIRG